MSRPTCWKGTGRSLLAAATVVLSLALPALSGTAAAAQHEGIRWALTLHATVQRTGVPVHVRLFIVDGRYQNDDGHWIEEQSYDVVVNAQAHGQPGVDGSQTSYYSGSIDERYDPGFIHAHGTSRATVQVSHLAGDILRLDLRFDATHPGISSCDGHTHSRTGRLHGDVWFRPGGKAFGTLTQVPAHARLSHGDATCPVSSFPEPHFGTGPRCSSSAVYALGQKPNAPSIFRFLVRRDSGADEALVTAIGSNSSGQPYVWHTLHAALPADHVTIPDDLSSITIKGAPGSFLTGSAHADATGTPMPSPLFQGCSDPTPGTATTTREAGTYTGDLAIDFIPGGTHNVGKQPIAATAASGVYPGTN